MAWFDSLTGFVEDEPGTQPRLLDLAARAAHRSVHDEDDEEDAEEDTSEPPIAILTSSTEGISPSRPTALERTPRPKQLLVTGELTLQKNPAAPPNRPVPETGPTIRKTFDLSDARTVLREEGESLPPRSFQQRWSRRLKELWPYMLGGAGGGAALWVALRFLSH